MLHTMSTNEIKLTKASSLKQSDWIFISKDIYPDFFADTGKNNTGFSDYKDGQTDSDVDTDFFIIKPKKIHHARLHDRINTEVKVVLEGQNKSFESVTVDISEGGIFFKDAIPEWVSGYFIVRVFDGVLAYQVICSLVEDQKVKQRVQIVSEESDSHYVKYKDWLATLN
ncbi:MAG: PilZ domain-containing protein [Bdellovibrionaceae bacterium]|nr:PilZ domain-containing protein [Pseudobdellovibrionaceae bacterium]